MSEAETIEAFLRWYADRKDCEIQIEDPPHGARGDGVADARPLLISIANGIDEDGLYGEFLLDLILGNE